MQSNRTYMCVVCGQIRRAPLPPGLIQWLPEAERKRKQLLHGIDWPEDVVAPAPYGHWRSWVVEKTYTLPR